mmetsp:Transcript_16438/g.35701  ORF Transcript_16438/g.35701 Transcript_16438/m.35701 type:complete len:528 (+) Transcript_16438:85-1668(+)
MRKKRPPQLIVSGGDCNGWAPSVGEQQQHHSQQQLRGGSTRHRPFFSLAGRKDSFTLRSFERASSREETLGAFSSHNTITPNNNSFGSNKGVPASHNHRGPQRPVLSSGDDGKFWVAARRGSRRTDLEDSWSSLECGLNGTLFGVFDGHGGKAVSDLCQQKLLQTAFAGLASGSPPFALSQAFAQLDVQAAALGRTGRGSSDGNGGNDDVLCGSTASVVWFRGGMLHVASVGDSRVVLATADGRAVDLTRDHRATCEEEVTRIEGRGGFVLMNRVNGALALSRALGDHKLKPVISAEPDIHSRPVGTSDELLIVASDGLWDVMSSQQAVSMALSRFRSERAKGISMDRILMEVSNELLARAFDLGTVDDVTVMVLNVYSFRGCQPSSLFGGARSARFRESHKVRRLELGASGEENAHAAFCKLLSHGSDGGSDGSTDDLMVAHLTKRRSTASTTSFVSGSVGAPLTGRISQADTVQSGAQNMKICELDDFSLSSLTSGVTIDGARSVPKGRSSSSCTAMADRIGKPF